jgi:hypothetical protein
MYFFGGYWRCLGEAWDETDQGFDFRRVFSVSHFGRFSASDFYE